MIKRSKTVSLIGFATKARKLTVGTEITVETVRSGKKNGVYLMLYASDASENTKKRVRDCGAYHKVPVRELKETSDQLSQIMGKLHAVAVIGVADEGFAKAIIIPLPTTPSPKKSLIAARNISLAPPLSRRDEIITDIATGSPVVATVQKSVYIS